MSIYDHVDASVEAPSGPPEQVSQRALDLLHHFEGFRHDAYLDAVGIWTIGYGNTRWPDGRPVRKGDHVTKEQGEQLFRTILRTFERGVLKAAKVPLTQPQFDALVSFAYNVGLGALGASTLLRKLNAGEYREAADQFLRWNKAGGKVLAGLTRRREAERVLFLS